MTLKRISIMLDEKLVTKIRNLQADELKKSHASVSFSATINKTLAKHLGVNLD